MLNRKIKRKRGKIYLFKTAYRYWFEANLLNRKSDNFALASLGW